MSDEPTKEAAEETAEQKQPTQEELKEVREKQQQFMEEQIPYLEVEAKFQKLKANIQESKARSMKAMAIQAEIARGVQAPAGVPDNGPHNAATAQPQLGEDGFPIDWTQEQKIEYLEEQEKQAEEQMKLIKEMKSDVSKTEATNSDEVPVKEDAPNTERKLAEKKEG